METVATLLGFMAGTLTTVAFIPQLIQVYQTKSARDISYPMFFIFIMGILSWIAYGVSIRELPIIVTNSITFIVATAILVLKLKYDAAYKRTNCIATERTS